MTSTHHGEAFELRKRNSIPQPAASATGSEAQPTPIFVLCPPNEPAQVYSQTPSSTPEPHEGSLTWPLLSSRSQSPNEPRGSLEDHETLLSGRQSEATERYSTSSTPRKDYSWPASAGSRRQPKPITRNGWQKFVTGWLVHLPALLTTIVVVVFNRKKLYWFSEEGIRGSGDDPKVKITADAVNNALQLPAKLHELMIVASLSSIALAMLRRRLITDGVRLGFLTGGYRVGDLPYLRTMAFWRLGVDIHRPWEVLLAGFVVFATILSTVVGPTSAVLIVPTLGWYPLDHGRAFSKVQLPLLYRLHSDLVWPRNLTDYQAPFSHIPQCKDTRAIYHPWCPAGGFSELYAWAYRFRASDLSDNLRFQFPPTKLRRELVITATDPFEVNSTTICTTPSHFLMVSWGLFWDYLDDKGGKVGEISNNAPYRLQTNRSAPIDSAGKREKQGLFQPFVQSKCRFADPSRHPVTKPLKETLNDTIEYPTKFLNCFGAEDCLELQLKGRIVSNYSHPWLGDERWQYRSVTSGFTTSGNSSTVLTLVGQLPEKGNNSLYVCTFLASWVNSTFTVDPKESDILNSTVNQKEILRSIIHNNSSRDLKVIRFDRNFMPYLMPPIQLESTSTQVAGVRNYWSPLDRIVDLFAMNCEKVGSQCAEPVMDADPEQIEAFLSKIFGAYLTDFLARTGAGYRTILKLSERDNRLDYLEFDNQYGRNSGPKAVEPFNATHSKDLGTKDKFIRISKDLLDSCLPIDFAVERYGYGSGQSGPTVDFALAIMYIYLGVVAIYATAVGVRHLLEFFRFSWHGKPVRVLSVIPWSDLQDLMVLALKTTPPSNRDFVDSGAGVSSNRVWDRVVTARADDDLNVQLVLDYPTHTTKLDDTGQTRYH